MVVTDRQKEVAFGLTIILVVVLGFGAGEAALRILQQSKFGTADSVEKSTKFHVDEQTGLRLPKPGSVHGKIHYNSLGFRGPEIVVIRPPGTLRIAFLGNSTTLDAYSSDQQSWPAVAAAELQRAAPQCKVEYLNAGVAGFATDRVLRYFDGHVASLHPDVVVVLPRDVNKDMDEYVIRHKLNDGVHYRPSWLAAHSVLWAKVEMNTTIVARQRAAGRPDGKVPIDANEVVGPFGERLRKLLQSIADSGAIPVVMTMTGRMRWEQSEQERVQAAVTDVFYMPYASMTSLLEVRDAYNDQIRRVAGEMGVAVIESHMEVPGDATYFQDSLHFAPAGSDFAGRRVGGDLLRDAAVAHLLTTCGSEAPSSED